MNRLTIPRRCLTTMTDYYKLIETKFNNRIFEGISDGVTVSEKLFDFQQAIVKWALRKGRACVFADCGMGKTPVQLEWARNVHQATGKPVLIVAPLAVSAQTVHEGKKFDVEVNFCRTKEDVANGINITNYESLAKFDPSVFVGVVLDESSILKSYTGKTKRLIIESFANTKYRLCCTATPAPNNLIELLNHAEFLGVMKSGEALTIWFTNDTQQACNLRLKHNATKSFYEWVSSWAVCLSTPSDIGFSDDKFILPPLEEVNHIVYTEQTCEGDRLFRSQEISATTMFEEKRRTLKERVNEAIDIINSTDEQIVVWCETNDEATLLKKALADCKGGSVEVRGSHTVEYKEQSAIDFINGKYRVLISKPSIFGFGLNFQNCCKCVFVSMSYSFEGYYQAVRRFWRFGQTLPVTIHRVIADTEYNILTAIERKQKQKNDVQGTIASIVKDIQTAELNGQYYRLNIAREQFDFPEWIREEVIC